ncbi:splicing regulatory glutamine/lysine-rich protein 1 [Exaiptasia diaphana]|uniref:Uncharacterized protein n=1 Tax=Exaiptasia diaphana TaxID=2652724 RepID=A0A913X975_EXADI|nr:splicing regulatory glutamine/lysine-rich protein 1 [Exaiptasia diaphana]KXJ26696.1 hypothetical protein AC249_AIPGENE9257 [Exaiptasia diaphana]
MSVASLESYTYCFEQVEKAYDAIEQGEANKAAFILCSVRDDAKLIQEQSEMYYKGLLRLQTAQQKRMENLTAEINDLYNEEKRYSKQERELGIQKQKYIQARESEEASKMAAERRYRDAEREKEKHLKEQRERDEKGKNFWWVFGYNLYLIFDDWMKDNRRKARDASREMEKHQNMIQEAEKEMEKLSYEEVKVRNEIKASEQKQCNTNEQRKSLHKKLGATREMIVLLGKVWRK